MALNLSNKLSIIPDPGVNNKKKPKKKGQRQVINT